MHIALTGVSGFIGSKVAQVLHREGHSITGLVRKTSRTDHIEPFVQRLVIGDQSDESVWPDLLQDAECVIHNSVNWQPIEEPVDLDQHLKSNLLGSIRLLDASAPRQFVFISTIAVHHDMLPRWHGQIDEDHPLRPGHPYGAYKAAVEAHLWDAHYRLGQHTCALRPCAVYGIDPKLDRTIGYPIVKRILKGKNFSRSGGGKFVHVDDVAAAVLATLGNPDAAGKAYNMADCYARWADLAQITCDLLNVEVEIDFSSPNQAKNVFKKDRIETLGVKLDRGQEGIRNHLSELISLMKD